MQWRYSTEYRKYGVGLEKDAAGMTLGDRYNVTFHSYKMYLYGYPMYCKMLGVGTRNSTILKKKNVWKSLVEPNGGILVRFSIFSIHLRLIGQVV